jgi:hypothetical protein
MLLDIPGLEYILKEWRVITQAPVIFTTAVVVVILTTWATVRFLYGREISGLGQQIKVLESTRDHYKVLAEDKGKAAGPSPVMGFMNRENLVSALRSQTERPPVSLFYFLRFPQAQQHVDELLSAFMEAGWVPGRGDADSQPFILEKGDKYQKGIWVIGTNTEIVASGLFEAEMQNVRTDRNPSLGSTIAIVIGG